MMEVITHIYTIRTTALSPYQMWLKYQYIIDVCLVAYFLWLVAEYAIQDNQWWGLLAYSFAGLLVCNISSYKDDYNKAMLGRMIEKEYGRRFVK